MNEGGRDWTAANGRRLGAARPRRHTVAGGRIADGRTGGTALVQALIAT